MYTKLHVPKILFIFQMRIGTADITLMTLDLLARSKVRVAKMRKGGGIWLSARAAATVLLLGGPSTLTLGFFNRTNN